MTADFVRNRLDALRAADLFRAPPVVATADGVHGTVDGRPATLFCSNDYLGLRMDPRVRAAAGAAADAYGAGSGSSRLIAGSLPVHRDLEAALADWMGTEAALVCSSGYQANVALLQALGGRHDRIYSDALNHASLIDGCRLSHARVRKVPHGDVAALREALAEDVTGEQFVLGEGLYSMDGDRGPVAEQAEACTDAWLLVDEAHAVGVLGPAGRGVCAEQGVGDHPRLLARVGTFGKAFGSHGAFVACSAAVRDLLVNSGRTYVFTTGLPPAAAGAAAKALEIVQSDEGEALRARVLRHARRIVDALQERGLGLAGLDPAAPGPIIPILAGSADAALTLAARLLDAGIYAKAIRPPTVPPGTSRIRVTVSAAHTDDDIDRLLGVLS